MDNLLSIGLGFGMRLVVNNLSPYHPRVQSTILGVWEGVVLHHFIRKMPSSFDPSVAYGVRIFADLVYTKNVVRMALVVLWSAVAFLISDTMGPRHWNRPVEPRKKKTRRVVSFVPDSPNKTYFRPQSIIRPRPPPDSPLPVRLSSHVVLYSLGERTSQSALGAQLSLAPPATLTPFKTSTGANLDDQDSQEGPALVPFEVPDISFYLSDADLDDLENRYSPTGHDAPEASTAVATLIHLEDPLLDTDLLVDEAEAESEETPTIRTIGLPSAEEPLQVQDVAIISPNPSPPAQISEDPISTSMAVVTCQDDVSKVDEEIHGELESIAESSQTLASTESAILESDPFTLRQEAERLRQAALAEDGRQRQLEHDNRLRISTKRAFLLKQEIKKLRENSIKLHKAAERRYFRCTCFLLQY